MPLSKSPDDAAAAQRLFQFTNGWFTHPIFHKDGDYPKVMKDRIEMLSKAEGRVNSRLPEFTLEEITKIRGKPQAMAVFGIGFQARPIFLDLIITRRSWCDI